ncbi:T-cell surface glycoprotein CD3 epsilon chain isoform X2 [Tamandua tetradactyla]|uniref:T-cell surface glycoprotein CD3 epsilon chain isoform X2 n=1 Tax=Tamandua tetradactyla TaxID=48850 RepID=UPI00405431C5
MQPDTFWIVLGLCLFSVGAWGEDNEENEFKVAISGTTVILTCPEDHESEEIQWEKNSVQLPNKSKDIRLENFSEMEDSGYFACYVSNSKEKKHHLYLRARVCENCVEVDLMVVIAVVIGDVCVTLGLLLVVYYWSKNRKAKAKPMKRGVGAGGRPRGQNKERPPPVPNPDYELSLLRPSLRLDWMTIGRYPACSQILGPEPALRSLPSTVGHWMVVGFSMYTPAPCQLTERRNKVYLAERVAVPCCWEVLRGCLVS